MNYNHNLTETDIDSIDIKSQLEHPIQQPEMKDSGLRFDKINSMIICFYRTGEIDGRSYVKIPLRSNSISNIENNDKYCFLWSKIASLHPCKSNHPNRVSNYRQYFNELNIEEFDFTNGLSCSDLHKLEKLNNLPKNVFELTSYQDQKKWNINYFLWKLLKLNR